MTNVVNSMSSKCTKYFKSISLGVAKKKCLEALFLPIFKLYMSQIIHYHP